jgi:hypothetical protein
MDQAFLDALNDDTEALRGAGLYKDERIIASPQAAEITLADGAHVINFCANNYLGLSNHPALIAAAKEALDCHGFGLSSVRFICGTQTIHKDLEGRIGDFLGTQDTILYFSCFDANTGLFETILGPEDAVISDALNHASVIDGIRLCKARRLRYANNDMAELERRLIEARDCRRRLIATDGVFSMDGVVATSPRSAISPSAMAPWSWSMIPTRWASWAPAGAARRSIAGWRIGSIFTPAHWARPWAAPRGATAWGAPRSSPGCASAPGPTCFPTAWRRPSRRPPSPRSICWRPATICATPCTITAAISAPAWRASVSPWFPANIRSSR